MGTAGQEGCRGSAEPQVPRGTKLWAENKKITSKALRRSWAETEESKTFKTDRNPLRHTEKIKMATGSSSLLVIT